MNQDAYFYGADGNMGENFGPMLFHSSSAQEEPQVDDGSYMPWGFAEGLEDLNLPPMPQDQLSLAHSNVDNHHHLSSEMPQIQIAIPSNHPYSPMAPHSSHIPSPNTPSYTGPSSSTTDDSRRFFPSPNTPYLSPGGEQRFNNIVSGTNSLASSPTIHSPYEFAVKSEASPNRLPVHPIPVGSRAASRGRSVSAPGSRGAVIVNSSVRGAIVPQKRYKPHTQSDRKRYVDEIDLKPTIYFKDYKNGEVIDGLPIALIMQNRIPGLQGRDDSMLSDCGPSISVRINWPGYTSWSRQIPTRDFRTPPQPVTRAKLAKNVAKTVERFIAEHHNQAMDDDGDAGAAAANQNWKIGGHGGIEASDLALVHLEHVSKGSWQVQLQLLHPRGPSPQGTHF